MALSSQHSVSQWIAELKDQEAEAAQRIWERYVDKLLQLAKQRLGHAPRRVADEEDIAQSVFISLCRAAAEGRLSDVKKRDELWWLLIRLTQHKVTDYVRRETAKKRGGGLIQAEGILARGEERGGEFSLDELFGKDLTPDFLVILADEHQRLLGLLRDDQMRNIANSRIEGYSTHEIAEQHSTSTRTIERKLRLIRSTWSKEIDW